MTAAAVTPPHSSPFELNIRKLRNRPGRTDTVELSIPADGAWANAVAQVQAQTPVTVRLDLESVVEGIWAHGQVSTTFQAECSRCLRELSQPIAVQVQELFLYPEAAEPAAESDEDADPIFLVSAEDSIDLTEPIHDTMVLELPLLPLCGPDCPGLCSECGVDLATHPDHVHEQQDPRWAALAHLASEATAESVSETEHHES